MESTDVASTDMALEARVSAALEAAVRDGVTPGAACAIAIDGEPAAVVAAGHAASHDSDGAVIPVTSRRSVTQDAVYDLASVSKLFTSITLLSLAEEGAVELDASVGEWLPQYRTSGRSAVTLTHLLSHTSGLPPTYAPIVERCVQRGRDRSAHWSTPDRAHLLDDIAAVPLRRPAGEDKVYSCLGYITAMMTAEAATNRPWADLVHERVIAPLALTRTTFSPDARLTVPTEFQPDLGRGMVHAVVHDETACALGGAAGNAGLFSPVTDLASLGSALLSDLGGVLRPASFDLLWENQLPRILGSRARAVERRLGYGQSLGLRLGQSDWMSEPGREARGHTGFTGTSLLVDREKHIVVALLMNSVHPRRSRSDAMAVRRVLSEIAYAA